MGRDYSDTSMTKYYDPDTRRIRREEDDAHLRIRTTCQVINGNTVILQKGELGYVLAERSHGNMMLAEFGDKTWAMFPNEYETFFEDPAPQGWDAV